MCIICSIVRSRYDIHRVRCSVWQLFGFYCAMLGDQMQLFCFNPKFIKNYDTICNASTPYLQTHTWKPPAKIYKQIRNCRSLRFKFNLINPIWRNFFWSPKCIFNGKKEYLNCNREKCALSANRINVQPFALWFWTISVFVSIDVWQRLWMLNWMPLIRCSLCAMWCYCPRPALTTENNFLFLCQTSQNTWNYKKINNKNGGASKLKFHSAP